MGVHVGGEKGHRPRVASTLLVWGGRGVLEKKRKRDMLSEKKGEGCWQKERKGVLSEVQKGKGCWQKEGTLMSEIEKIVRNRENCCQRENCFRKSKEQLSEIKLLSERERIVARKIKNCQR